MQVDNEAKEREAPIHSLPAASRTQALARAGVVIAGQPSSSTLYINRTTATTGLTSPLPPSPPYRGASDSSLSASLRRKFAEVKDSGLALRRSISNAGAPYVRRVRAPKHTRSKSESLGQGFNTGLRHLQGRAASSAVSLSLGIGEEPPFELDSDSDVGMEDNDDVKVPLLLQKGTLMVKVSAKKKKSVMFRIDADEGYILWESKKSGVIPIENIKEIRSGADARYYREQFQLSADYEARWLTIIYIVDGRYKTLHAVAMTVDEFALWDSTLRALLAVRQELMNGLGHVNKRQNVWERRYWRSADEGRDDKLSFEEVEKMCKRLNISFSKAEMLRRFQEADTQLRGYLDFSDFRRFVKLLKRRPELENLYDTVCHGSPFNFSVFEEFMRGCQMSTLSDSELTAMFLKHASCPETARKPPAGDFPPTPPLSEPSIPSTLPPNGADSPARTQLPAAGKENSASINPSRKSATEVPSDTKSLETDEENDVSELTMSLDSFTTFLLSNDNSVFSDHHGKIWQDMTCSLSEYFISSSHNTYLVGHQLVGVSTIEGYIRALLHGCRSVEVDVYDGETEPVIYHGKTLTSKVPLRDICQAIAKYAFVASPYPIIISAEVHCSVPQQNKAAIIMREVFGDSLVTAPVDSRPEIIKLPSPEDLRGRVLLKAKSLYVSESSALREKTVTVDSESSSTSDTSPLSDTEFIHDIKVDLKHELSKARNVDAVKDIREEVRKMESEAALDMKDEFGKVKEEFGKARNLYERVRRRKSPSPALSKRQALPPLPESSSSQAAGIKPVMESERKKVKISFELAALLVYTVGVKCRGFNKKETYAPEHVFSLSERTANKVLKQSMFDLVKHNRTHLVRIYPSGTRLNSSNFEPHRFWAAGAQLVAINWQTSDLGYMINHAMFQRNGRSGYVLKPEALRTAKKEYLSQRTNHIFNVKIISAQQLPRRKDSEGREIVDNNIVDPYVEVSIHVPDWLRSPFKSDSAASAGSLSSSVAALSVSSASSALLGAPIVSTPSSSAALAQPTPPSPAPAPTPSRVTSARTTAVKNNGFNPAWEEHLALPFDVVADMRDLVFVRFAVCDDSAGSGGAEYPLAVYCCPLGSMQMGYRHLPLHDAQLSQYLFSTLFVHIDVKDV